MEKQETIDRLVAQAGITQLQEHLRTIVESAYDNGVLAGVKAKGSVRWEAASDVSRETSGLAAPKKKPPEPTKRLKTFAVFAGGFYMGSELTREDAETWANELLAERPSWPFQIRRMVEIHEGEWVTGADTATAYIKSLENRCRELQVTVEKTQHEVHTLRVRQHELQNEVKALRARQRRSHWIEAVVENPHMIGPCIRLPSGILDHGVPYHWRVGETVLIQRKDAP